jgi:hypothetical protein
MISWTPKITAAASSVMPGQTSAQIPAATVMMPNASPHHQCRPIALYAAAGRYPVLAVIRGLPVR